jgi:hypothetical protein
MLIPVEPPVFSGAVAEFNRYCELMCSILIREKEEYINGFFYLPLMVIIT